MKKPLSFIYIIPWLIALIFCAFFTGRSYEIDSTLGTLICGVLSTISFAIVIFILMRNEKEAVKTDIELEKLKQKEDSK